MVLTREENCLGAETKLPKGVPIATLLLKFKTQTLKFVVTTTHTTHDRAIHRAKTPNSSQKGLLLGETAEEKGDKGDRYWWCQGRYWWHWGLCHWQPSKSTMGTH